MSSQIISKYVLLTIFVSMFYLRVDPPKINISSGCEDEYYYELSFFSKILTGTFLVIEQHLTKPQKQKYEYKVTVSRYTLWVMLILMMLFFINEISPQVKLYMFFSKKTVKNCFSAVLISVLTVCLALPYLKEFWYNFWDVYKPTKCVVTTFLATAFMFSIIWLVWHIKGLFGNFETTPVNVKIYRVGLNGFVFGVILFLSVYVWIWIIYISTAVVYINLNRDNLLFWILPVMIYFIFAGVIGVVVAVAIQKLKVVSDDVAVIRKNMKSVVGILSMFLLFILFFKITFSPLFIDLESKLREYAKDLKKAKHKIYWAYVVPVKVVTKTVP